jgi:CheY-like chemotaxis protein
MANRAAASAARVLLVDDNVAIHDDYEKVLVNRGASRTDELDALEASLFPSDEPPPPEPEEDMTYDLVHAHQGEEAVRLVEQTTRGSEEAFAIAFVDMRMPPGIDGLETIRRIWAIDPRIEVVICSAYSDYSRDQIDDGVGQRRVLFLSKPFDACEVEDVARTLADKYAAKVVVGAA